MTTLENCNNRTEILELLRSEMEVTRSRLKALRETQISPRENDKAGLGLPLTTLQDSKEKCLSTHESAPSLSMYSSNSLTLSPRTGRKAQITGVGDGQNTKRGFQHQEQFSSASARLEKLKRELRGGRTKRLPSEDEKAYVGGGGSTLQQIQTPDSDRLSSLQALQKAVEAKRLERERNLSLSPLIGGLACSTASVDFPPVHSPETHTQHNMRLQLEMFIDTLKDFEDSLSTQEKKDKAPAHAQSLSKSDRKEKEKEREDTKTDNNDREIKADKEKTKKEEKKGKSKDKEEKKKEKEREKEKKKEENKGRSKDKDKIKEKHKDKDKKKEKEKEKEAEKEKEREREKEKKAEKEKHKQHKTKGNIQENEPSPIVNISQGPVIASSSSSSSAQKENTTATSTLNSSQKRDSVPIAVITTPENTIKKEVHFHPNIKDFSTDDEKDIDEDDDDSYDETDNESAEEGWEGEKLSDIQSFQEDSFEYSSSSVSTPSLLRIDSLSDDFFASQQLFDISNPTPSSSKTLSDSLDNSSSIQQSDTSTPQTQPLQTLLETLQRGSRINNSSHHNTSMNNDGSHEIEKDKELEKEKEFEKEKELEKEKPEETIKEENMSSASDFTDLPLPSQQHPSPLPQQHTTVHFLQQKSNSFSIGQTPSDRPSNLFDDSDRSGAKLTSSSTAAQRRKKSSFIANQRHRHSTLSDLSFLSAEFSLSTFTQAADPAAACRLLQKENSSETENDIEAERDTDTENTKLESDYERNRQKETDKQLSITRAVSVPNSVVTRGPGISEKLLMRGRVFEELLQTERVFVKDLMLTSKLYYLPLKTSSVLEPKQISAVFSNMTMLLGVSNELLKELEKPDAINSVGSTFCFMMDFLKLYAVYCTNHPQAVKMLNFLRKSDPKFELFLKEQQSNSECRGLQLSGFLIKPVQRVTKYPLILKQLLNHTEKDHPDYEHLEQAISRCETILSEINEYQIAMESHERLILIRKTLPLADSYIDASHNFLLEDLVKEVSLDDPLIHRHTTSLEKKQMFYILLNSLLIRAGPKKKTLYPSSTLTMTRKGAPKPKDPIFYDKLRIVQVVPISHIVSVRNIFDKDLVEMKIKNAFELKLKKPKEGEQRLLIVASSPSKKADWLINLKAVCNPSTRANPHRITTSDASSIIIKTIW